MLLLKRTTNEQRGCKQSREPKEHHDRDCSRPVGTPSLPSASFKQLSRTTLLFVSLSFRNKHGQLSCPCHLGTTPSRRDSPSAEPAPAGAGGAAAAPAGCGEPGAHCWGAKGFSGFISPSRGALTACQLPLAFNISSGATAAPCHPTSSPRPRGREAAASPQLDSHPPLFSGVTPSRHLPRRGAALPRNLLTFQTRAAIATRYSELAGIFPPCLR